MNSEKPEPLDKLLAEWSVDATPPPGFRAGVWQAIAAEESAREAVPPGFWAGLLQTLSRHPAWGAATVMLLAVSLGGGLGHRGAELRRTEQQTQMAQRYAQSINPVALAALESHPDAHEH